MKKTVIIILVVVFLLIGGILFFNTNVEVEYVPETEIEEVDLRKTMVTLYFKGKENNELQKETRLIDSKDLLLDPYTELLNMLIAGPESDFLEKTIPDDAQLMGVELVGDVLQIHFAQEFNSEDKDMCISAISSTMKELNEVREVEVLFENVEISENV